MKLFFHFLTNHLVYFDSYRLRYSLVKVKIVAQNEKTTIKSPSTIKFLYMKSDDINTLLWKNQSYSLISMWCKALVWGQEITFPFPQKRRRWYVMDHRANDIMEYPFDTFTVLPTPIVYFYYHVLFTCAFFPRLDDQKMEEIKVWKVLLLIMFSTKSFGCVKKLWKN